MPRAIVAVCQAGSLKVLPYGLLANVIFGYFPRTGAKNLIGGTRQRKNSSALVCAIGEVATRDFAARWQSALYSLGVSYCCCVVASFLSLWANWSGPPVRPFSGGESTRCDVIAAPD